MWKDYLLNTEFLYLVHVFAIKIVIFFLPLLTSLAFQPLAEGPASICASVLSKLCCRICPALSAVWRYVCFWLVSRITKLQKPSSTCSSSLLPLCCVQTAHLTPPDSPLNRPQFSFHIWWSNYALLVTAICQHIIIKDKLIQPNRSSRKLFMTSMNVNMCAYAVHK